MRKLGECKFDEYNCDVYEEQYENERPAIVLYDKEDDETILIATVNLDNYDLKDKEVLIKDYSENEGILDILVKAEIITPAYDMISIGFVVLHKCMILK